MEWLDDWCLEMGDEVRVYDRGVRLLRELSAAAIDVCREVWKTVCEVRCERERSEVERRERREKEERRARAKRAREVAMARRTQHRLRQKRDIIDRKRLAAARHKAGVVAERLARERRAGNRLSAEDCRVVTGE